MTRRPAFDGLRGLAILFVLLSHLVGGASATGNPVAHAVLIACHSGWLGVDLFFVLSGFLITAGLLESRESPGYWRNFYARRVLRIFPLYYGVLFVVFVVLPHVPACPEGVCLLAPRQARLWTYTLNLSAARGGLYNAPGVFLQHFWSLAIEEQFYLVWPFVVRYQGHRLATICAWTLGVSLTARILAAVLGAPTEAIYFATPLHIDGLAAGAMLATLRPRLQSLRPYAPIVATFTVGGLAILAGHYGDLRATSMERKPFTKGV